jgi:hypothetical protein
MDLYNKAEINLVSFACFVLFHDLGLPSLTGQAGHELKHSLTKQKFSKQK